MGFVGSKQSFKCDTNRTLPMEVNTTNSTNAPWYRVSISTRYLRVQAYTFANESASVFDSNCECTP